MATTTTSTIDDDAPSTALEFYAPAMPSPGLVEAIRRHIAPIPGYEQWARLHVLGA